MKTPIAIMPSVRPGSAGFTLVEMMIAVVISVVLVGFVVALSIISVQNFAATSNYVQMNDQSRLALDLASREIRNATSVMGFSTSNPKFILLTNANSDTSAKIAFTPPTDTTGGFLTLERTSYPISTLLTNCDDFNFQLYNRYPLITTTNISFYLSTNSSGQLTNSFCKVINMNWKCSRTILGSKMNTEIVQTAQVVLRNQVSQ